MSIGGAAGSISSLQIARVTDSGHRVSVPVRPSQIVFSQYRHIFGTAAASGQRTVPITRIQLLNSLISNLQKMKSDAAYNVVHTSDSSPERTDSLINQYAAELHQVMKSMPESFGTLGGTAAAGMVFDIAV